MQHAFAFADMSETITQLHVSFSGVAAARVMLLPTQTIGFLPTWKFAEHDILFEVSKRIERGRQSCTQH